MKVEEHCETSLERFGKPFREVHEWLDFYFKRKGEDEEGSYDYTGLYSLTRHWEKRHHVEGIAECVKLFGEEARAVAETHILEDLRHHPRFKFNVPSRSDYPALFWKED